MKMVVKSKYCPNSAGTRIKQQLVAYLSKKNLGYLKYEIVLEKKTESELI